MQALLLMTVSLATGCFSAAGHDNSTTSQDSVASSIIEKAYGDGNITADFSAFPTLHPLVVNVSLIFLLLAAVAQLAAFFVYNGELSWVTLVLNAGGYLGTMVAVYFVHPHKHGLPE